MQLSRRQISCLVLSILAIAMGQSVVFAVLPPLGREIHLSELQITSIVACSALIFGVASPRWGRYSDRVGRKPVMLIGLTGYTLGMLIFASLLQAALIGLLGGLTLYLLLLLFRGLQAAVMAASSPAGTAYAADHTSPAQRTRVMARIGASHSLGTILGPAISGALATISLLAPLFFASLFAAAVALFVALRLPGEPRDRGQLHRPQARMKYTDPRVVRYLASAVGLFLGFASIQQTLGFSIQDQMNLGGIETAQRTGIALMVSAIFAFSVQMVLIQRLNLSRDTIICLGLISLITASLLVANFSNYLQLHIGMAFMGTGFGLALPSISASTSLAVSPEEQGAVAGLLASCPAIGFVVGPLLAGFLYQLDGSYASLFSTVVFTTLLLVMWPSRPRTSQG